MSGKLLSSLRSAVSLEDRALSDEVLHQVVGRAVASMLRDNDFEQSPASLRRRAGEALVDAGLESVAFRYDAALDPAALVVGKHDGRSDEPFDREKLVRSIISTASKFLDRVKVEDIVNEIEDELGGMSSRTSTDELRRIAGKALRARDERAFLRYALGGRHLDNSLGEFLERIAPTAQVRKRDRSIVLFDGVKLGKSIRRSFVADRREHQSEAIAAFVAEEELRVRARIAETKEPEPTSSIGKRVLVWLFAQDELAWANYWLAFESDHKSRTSPATQLADAHRRMEGLTLKAQ